MDERREMEGKGHPNHWHKEENKKKEFPTDSIDDPCK